LLFSTCNPIINKPKPKPKEEPPKDGIKPSENDTAAAATNGPSTDQPADTTEPMSEQKDAQADDAKADMELD